MASHFKTSLIKKILLNCLILLSIIFCKIDYAKADTIIKTSHVLSSDELSKIFKDPLFISIENEMAQILNLKMPNEKRSFSDLEIAFKWGSDWLEIHEFVQDRDRFSQEMERKNIPFYNSNFISKRKRQQQFKILNEENLLEPKKQIKLLEASYSDRLKQLSNDLPGFFDWFTEGFKIPWILTSEPLNASFCENKNSYKIKQKIVACQSLESVKIQKDWFESSSSQEIADIFIHELIRYRVIWLAKNISMPQEEQDLLTALITVNILNNEISSSEIFNLLTSASLIPKIDIIEKIRLYEVDFLINAQINYIKDMMYTNATCSRFNKDIYAKDIKKFTDKILNLITSCRRYLTANMSSDLCSTKFLSFHIYDNRINCADK